MMVSGKPAGKGDDVFPFPAAWLPGDRLLYSGNGGIHITTLETNQTADIAFRGAIHAQSAGVPAEAIRFRFENCEGCERHREPGRFLLTGSVVFEALNQLWLMDIGGKPRQLTHDKFYKEDPAWSPDGKRIAYSSDKAGTEDIYVMDVATGSEKRVTTFADSAEVAAAWSPDGKDACLSGRVWRDLHSRSSPQARKNASRPRCLRLRSRAGRPMATPSPSAR
jgi:hypothetical protein